MGTIDRIDLLSRIARTASASQSSSAAGPLAVLSLSAASFGARPSEEATIPTGFDPIAVSLFEAIVEGAYLVANADGVVDEEERRTFERVVVAACGGALAPGQVATLLADCRAMLDKDGLDQRIAILTGFVRRLDHRHELLRVASLLAMASEGVNDRERAVLEKLAAGMGLGSDAVDAALGDATKALTPPLAT
jgi:tellurite resistance protein